MTGSYSSSTDCPSAHSRTFSTAMVVAPRSAAAVARGLATGRIVPSAAPSSNSLTTGRR